MYVLTTIGSEAVSGLYMAVNLLGRYKTIGGGLQLLTAVLTN